MTSIFLGRFSINTLSDLSNISEDVRKVLTEYFDSGDILDIILYPDDYKIDVIPIKDKDKTVTVILKKKVLPQFFGSYPYRDLERESKAWHNKAQKKLAEFSEEDTLALIYYPDFEIVKIFNSDLSKVEYISGVECSQ